MSLISNAATDSNGTDLTHQLISFVIPAKGGIHFQVDKIKMDSGLRRDDDAKSVPFATGFTLSSTCGTCPR